VKRDKLVFLAAFLLFFLLINMQVSFATDVEYHQIKIYLNPQGYALFNITVKYSSLTSERVPYFLLYSNIIGLKAYDSKGLMNCTEKPTVYGTFISCKPNMKERKNYTVHITFILKGLVHPFSQEKPQNQQDNHAKYIFRYEYNIKEPTKTMEIMLYLPEGFGLVKMKNTTPYYPKNAIITSDGRHVILEWNLKNPELGNTLLFSAIYEKVLPMMPKTFFNRFSQQIWLITFLVILFLLFLIYKVMERRKIAFELIREDERKILEYLEANKDKFVKQKDIVRHTGFSKAKVSRLITELEKRGIVERERIGRTNRVRLKKRF